MIRFVARVIGGAAAGAMGTIAMGGTSFFMRRMVEPGKPISKTHYEAVVEWAVERAGGPQAVHADAPAAAADASEADVDEPAESAAPAPILDEATRIRAGELTHIAFGAFWGAVFAVLMRNTQFRPMKHGVTAGLVLWVGAFEGYMPALGITRSLRQMKPYELFRTLVCHLVYAVTTFTFLRAFSSRR